VPRIRTDDHKDALAPDDAALLAAHLDGSSYFHLNALT
jgi:hypothetical protein